MRQIVHCIFTNVFDHHQIFYGINKFVPCCVRDSILYVKISLLKIEENRYEKNIFPSARSYYILVFFPILQGNIAPGKLNCSSADRPEMDSTKSKDASYIGKTIARFFDRTSSTWSKVHSKFLKERIRSEDDVEGCKNEARDGKMTILACLRISRDLEYVENSKREIGNTIRQ